MRVKGRGFVGDWRGGGRWIERKGEGGPAFAEEREASVRCVYVDIYTHGTQQRGTDLSLDRLGSAVAIVVISGDTDWDKN